MQITSVKFSNYKAFNRYSVSLSKANILVGPNNAGKSTILCAFRVLNEALRKARSRKPDLVVGPDGQAYGYEVSLRGLPSLGENVFHNYNQDEPATIEFRISSGNSLLLFFVEQDACVLIPKMREGASVRSVGNFKNAFPVTIGLIPILGPVDQKEKLYQKEAARLALQSNYASRNFRNIWHHYPEQFDTFQQVVSDTWPGMEIERPELVHTPEGSMLQMFCREERIAREICWAGFGFQVWCQMLTYIVNNSGATILVIDEPDIYLHSDLQRRLLALLKSQESSFILATHSTEILSEADTGDILSVMKTERSAKRIKNSDQLVNLFSRLGSSLNPVLAQIARHKKVIYVEGNDFKILSLFARKMGIAEVADKSLFSVIPAEGFNPGKVRYFTDGVQMAISSPIEVAVIFDRDYRSSEEVEEIEQELRDASAFASIHQSKELENYLLVPSAIDRAVRIKQQERARRTGEPIKHEINSEEVLQNITDEMKNDVQAQVLSRGRTYKKRRNPNLADTTITKELLKRFDAEWEDHSRRLQVVPGKEVLSRFNEELQRVCGVSVTPTAIISSMVDNEILDEMRTLIESLRNFVLDG